MGHLRVPSHVSRSLPIPQMQRSIEIHVPAHLQKGILHCVFYSHLHQTIDLHVPSVAPTRFLDWPKPATTSLLLGTVTDLARTKSELVAENALLCRQLILLRRHVKRPAFNKTDRMLLVLLARSVRTWKLALFIVKPETLLRWHRQGFRLYWK
jgi:hypothetical protein